MKLSKSELDKNKNTSKEYRSDFIAIIDDTRINIEVNNNSDEVTMKRNIDYLFRIYGSGAKKSRDKRSYKYNQVVQININNFSFEGHEEIVDIFTLNSNKDSKIRLTNDVIIIQIYLPKLREKWYDKGIESLTEEEKYILALIETDIDSSKELGKEIEIMEEYIEEVDEILDDEYFGESYDKELFFKEECYNDGVKDGIEKGIEKGIKEGIKEGISSRNIEIAKNMIKDKVDLEIISKYTGLSIEKINNL